MNQPLFYFEGRCRLDGNVLTLPKKVVDDHASQLLFMHLLQCKERIGNKDYRFLRACTSDDASYRRTRKRTALAVSLDSMDILLSPEHVAFAGLRDRAAYVGCGESFELWNPEMYRDYEERYLPRYHTLRIVW